MSISLTHREDGSIALFLDNDLQFDSNDERIYHEALVAPAVALSNRRRREPFKALIVGGGDGLVARELCKSRQLLSVDLVDYDPEVVELAQSDFADMNCSSLADPRVTVHIRDAWDFVGDAIKDKLTYDLIVVDLTVATDLMSARFHSIDWYENINAILSRRGIVAVNAVSPDATPEAFWSIFNSVTTAGLHARPYHVHIPSFAALDYGTDWGFLLASPESISATEFDNKTQIDQAYECAHKLEDFRPLFRLPEFVFDYQPSSKPGRAGSDILLQYFASRARIPGSRIDTSDRAELSTAERDSLLWDLSTIVIPQPDSGENSLPIALREAISECLQREQQTSTDSPDNWELTRSVLTLLPSLNELQTPEVIEDFVRDPSTFLQSIDIAALVKCLLERASELPAQLVAELELLRDKLVAWSGDYDSLLTLGHRIITILTLVVVLGNLLYPDAVYGKGGGHASYGTHRGGEGRGDRGDRNYGNRGRGYGGYRGYWGHHWGSYGWARPYHGFYAGGYVPPVYYANNYWNTTTPGVEEYNDETGVNYPARHYRYNQAYIQTYGVVKSAPSQQAQPPIETKAAYRLSDGADVLPDGRTVVPLTEQAYLMLTPQGTHVIDHATGATILTLASDPALMYQTSTEIHRQEHRLKTQISERSVSTDSAIPSTVTQSDATPNTSAVTRIQANVDKLQAASHALGVVPKPVETVVHPLVPGGAEVFAGVWMTADGKYLAIKRPNGHIAYMNGTAWYSDEGKTKLTAPYPAKFKPVACAFLSKIVKDSDSTKSMLMQDKNEGTAHLDMLNKELSDFQVAGGKPEDMVAYGSRQLKRSEAIRLTQLAQTRTNQKLQELQKQLDNQPSEIDLANKTLTNLGGA